MQLSFTRNKYLTKSAVFQSKNGETFLLKVLRTNNKYNEKVEHMCVKTLLYVVHKMMQSRNFWRSLCFFFI